jgi:hypothetical protein
MEERQRHCGWRRVVRQAGGYVVSALFLLACEGPVGEQGPVGPAGPQGEQGERGEQGRTEVLTEITQTMTDLQASLDSVRTAVSDSESSADSLRIEALETDLALVREQLQVYLEALVGLAAQVDSLDSESGVETASFEIDTSVHTEESYFDGDIEVTNLTWRLTDYSPEGIQILDYSFRFGLTSHIPPVPGSVTSARAKILYSVKFHDDDGFVVKNHLVLPNVVTTVTLPHGSSTEINEATSMVYVTPGELVRMSHMSIKIEFQ